VPAQACSARLGPTRGESWLIATHGRSPDYRGSLCLLGRSLSPICGIRLPPMPSDSERFRFLAKFRLHVTFPADHVTLMWQEKVQHWEASPPYYPVASGKTLEDATDAAIERWERKHHVTYSASTSDFVRLPFRGWVS
jgi:hypothetical protein